MKKEYELLIQDEVRVISLLANTSAFIMEKVKDLNWVGFYTADNNVLYLNAFQGKVACSVIPFERGVCGKAATTQKVINVPDVHKFDDHIACDSASNSELVIPLVHQGITYALLDIDSPKLNRFDKNLEQELVEIVQILYKKIDSLITAKDKLWNN
ncbi:GAF domain-containing protein [Mycoplasmopsis ciconiae]|uniref:GAF domain-containing protein n=1 Tax=Mycoplasmopsis ciconiae TaxID=561067 RepID=A0ABU7MKS1_9BACT|nr:GAF domain-containing protein [Mycoplasmopsis ciconiae]